MGPRRDLSAGFKLRHYRAMSGVDKSALVVLLEQLGWTEVTGEPYHLVPPAALFESKAMPQSFHVYDAERLQELLVPGSVRDEDGERRESPLNP